MWRQLRTLRARSCWFVAGGASTTAVPRSLKRPLGKLLDDVRVPGIRARACILQEVGSLHATDGSSSMI